MMVLYVGVRRSGEEGRREKEKQNAKREKKRKGKDTKTRGAKKNEDDEMKG